MELNWVEIVISILTGTCRSNSAGCKACGICAKGSEGEELE